MGFPPDLFSALCLLSSIIGTYTEPRLTPHTTLANKLYVSSIASASLLFALSLPSVCSNCCLQPPPFATNPCSLWPSTGHLSFPQEPWLVSAFVLITAFPCCRCSLHSVCCLPVPYIIGSCHAEYIFSFRSGNIWETRFELAFSCRLCCLKKTQHQLEQTTLLKKSTMNISRGVNSPGVPAQGLGGCHLPEAAAPGLWFPHSASTRPLARPTLFPVMEGRSAPGPGAFSFQTMQFVFSDKTEGTAPLH